MSTFAYSQYTATKVQTASPLALVVQLYAGAIRFSQQAATAIEKKDHSAKATALGRAQAIVTELRVALDRNYAPDLCQELDRLYDFVSRQLTRANIETKTEPLDSAILVLRELQESWAELARKEQRGELKATRQELGSVNTSLEYLATLGGARPA